MISAARSFVATAVLGLALFPGVMALAATARPDLALPVMPNSVFSGMDQAPRIVPTRMDALPALEGLPVQSEAMSLGGLWRYQADTDEVGLSEHWEAVSYDDREWAEIPVPSNYSREDLTLQSFFGPVWFRRNITLPDGWDGMPLTLRFEGVDYFARVWVNGQTLAGNGEHEGYFNPFQFDVTDLLVPGDNVVTVMVTNPYDYGQDQVGFPTIYPTLAEKVWIKGIFNFHDLRPGDGLRGPEKQDIGTGGIVGPIQLEKTGDVSVRAVFITPDLAADYRSAEIQIDLVLENHTAADRTLQVALELTGVTFSAPPVGQGLTVTLPSGLSRIEASIPLSSPRLWWPYDHPELGNPDLYRLTTSVVGEGAIDDRHVETFGIRRVEMTEEGPEAYWFKINGKRVFLRGTNVIPTEWLAETDRALFEQDAALFKETHMNVQRVHAHVQADPFYDVADEQGIVLHQDFALQWEYSPCDFERSNGDPLLTNNIEVMQRMLADMMYRLYNHPSIWLFTLHNEPLYVFTSAGQGELFPEPGTQDICRPKPYSAADPQMLMLDFSLNSTLDYDGLWPVASALEHSRPIHVGSGYGDAHLYDGWYSKTYNNMYEWAPAMATEYGAQGAPYRAEQFLQEDMGDDFWPPADGPTQHRWRYHDAQLANFGIYIGRAHDAYPDFATWAFATQLYQATVFKYGNEVLRMKRFNPTGVAINFTFQNWWDSITWGFVDADRTTLMAFEEMKTSFSPVAALVVTPANIYGSGDAIRLPITVVNDLHTAFPGATLKWELWEETDSYYLRGDPLGIFDHGNPGDPPTYAGVPPQVLTVTRGQGEQLGQLLEGQKTLDIPTDSGFTATELELEAPRDATVDRHFTLTVTLLAADGTLLHENWHHYVVVNDVAAFYRRTNPGIYPVPRFELSIQPSADGAEVTVTRRYANEQVFSGPVGLAGKVLNGLKPGMYEVVARRDGRRVSQQVTLNGHRKVRLELGSSVAQPAPVGRNRSSDSTRIKVREDGSTRQMPPSEARSRDTRHR